MKTIVKNVYYCDYCKKKKGLSKGAMSIHEKHCTGNINRVCRMCEKLEISNDLKALVEKYKNSFEIIKVEGDGIDSVGETITVKWKDKPITIEDILHDVDDCPNCALAILRLTGMNRHWFGINFDYKKAAESAFADINQNGEDYGSPY